VSRAPVSDLFGVKGRQWLDEQVARLPLDEQLTVAGCRRRLEVIESEIAALDRVLAGDALSDPDALRLMTLPGVGPVTAIAPLGATGDIGRFPTPRHLVGYLGLDPRVRQSGNQPAKHDGISMQRPGEVRGLLVEAAWQAARTAGPLRAFHQRISARRGSKIATVAVARKLVVIAWHLLTRGENYAYMRPALHAEKLGKLELAVGAPRHRGQKLPVRAFAPRSVRDAEHAQAVERRPPTGASPPAGNPPERRPGRVRARHRDTHLKGPQRAKPRGRPQVPDACTSLRQSPAPDRKDPRPRPPRRLDFHRCDAYAGSNVAAQPEPSLTKRCIAALRLRP